MTGPPKKGEEPFMSSSNLCLPLNRVTILIQPFGDGS